MNLKENMTTYIAIDADNGLSVPDGLIKFTVESIIHMIQNGATGEDIGRIGQHEIILGIRLAVAQRHIKDIAFLFEGSAIHVKPNGEQESWPENFPGLVCTDYLADLIIASYRHPS